MAETSTSIFCTRDQENSAKSCCVHRFMRAYPRPEEVDPIFDAIVVALGQDLDPQKMKDDFQALKEWAAGKTEEDVVTAMMSDDKR